MEAVGENKVQITDSQNIMQHSFKIECVNSTKLFKEWTDATDERIAKVDSMVNNIPMSWAVMEESLVRMQKQRTQPMKKQMMERLAERHFEKYVSTNREWEEQTKWSVRQCSGMKTVQAEEISEWKCRGTKQYQIWIWNAMKTSPNRQNDQ